MKTACKIQCPQCPFRPDALPGYLGSYTAPAIVSALWRNSPFYCHTKVNYSNPGWYKVAERQGKLCLGSLVFAKKMMAPLRADAYPESDPDVIEARRANQDRQDVDVMAPNTFLAYHDSANVAKHMKKLVIKSRLKKTPTSTEVYIKVTKKAAPKSARKGPRTNAEIEAEIAKLKALKPRIVPTSMFGDDNLRAIDDQIRVLEERMNEGDIYDRYDLIHPNDDDSDSSAEEADELNEIENRSMERADSAMEVYRWMMGTSQDTPSGNWEGLIQ